MLSIEFRTKPPAPLWGEIDTCAHWLFCVEFSAEQLLFDAFSQMLFLTESTFPFLYIIIQRWKSFKPPSSIRGGGEVDICPCRLFCMKFNAEQLWFQSSFDVIRIFGSVEPLSELTFLFLYIILFQRGQSLQPLTATLGRNRHIRPLTFLYAI